MKLQNQSLAAFAELLVIFSECEIFLQYIGFHDHTFNRAKLANYVISPGFHGFRRGFQ